MGDYFDSEELLKDFYIEAEQQVEKLEQNILAMEDDPSDRDAIDEIFRAAHTLKGGAATVQMTEIADFTHAVEDLLDGIRSNVCRVDSEVIDKILQSLDIIKLMLKERQQGAVYEDDVSQLKKELRAFLEKGGSLGDVSQAQSTNQSVVAVSLISGDSENNTVSVSSLPRELSQGELSEMINFMEEGKKIYRLRVEFDESNPMNSIGSIQVFSVVKQLGKVLRTDPDFDELYKDDFHQFVDYYVLTSESSDLLVHKCELSDITLSVGVTDIDDLDSRSGDLNLTSENLDQVVDSGQAGDSSLSTTSAGLAEGNIPVQGNVGTDVLKNGSVEAEESGKKKEKRSVKGGPDVHRKSQEVQQSQILRVDSRRIDSLLNLVSELVIIKGGFNQAFITSVSHSSSFPLIRMQFTTAVKGLLASLPQVVSRLSRSELSLFDLRKEIEARFLDVYTSMDSFDASIKQSSKKISSVTSDLGRITGELHEGVLKVRMVPIDQVFQRFPRLVRDLSRSLGKNVKLHIIGGETEMDKTVTEELVDPLMHCIRNSMDHGIETPDERLAAGKAEAGSLTLRASNLGNMVVIEIIDDGRGINAATIKQCAIDRGLINPGKVLTEGEIFSLIMEPGFSTAQKITDLSGRGVGLDVVKRSIERLNGEINITSELGKGSVFSIKLPLTLAILQGLLVRVGTDVYAIPITNVLESFRVKSNELNILDGTEVFNVREDVVSVVRLSKIFGIQSNKSEGAPHYLVLVGSEEKKVGLLIDELLGEEDVVIKPLKDRYTGSQGIAGATILGDGTVSLIIDVGQLLVLGLKQEMESHKNSVAADHLREIVPGAGRVLETEVAH